MSALIDCQELQHGTGSFIDHEAADCAAQLGDDDSSYARETLPSMWKLCVLHSDTRNWTTTAALTGRWTHRRMPLGLESISARHSGFTGWPRSLVPFVQRYSTAAGSESGPSRLSAFAHLRR